MSLLDDLSDIDELNRHLAADPGLAANMAEMGFIAKVPFQTDHNGAVVSKWDWTPYGRREMSERLNNGLDFALRHGQERKQ